LDQLWKLAVAMKDSNATFNEKAPEAWIRRAVNLPSQKGGAP
jgi:hypothetical protein